MKTRLFPILLILVVAMCFIFFFLGKDLVELKHANEVSMDAIETLQTENQQFQDTIAQLEKDKADLKTEIEKLTIEKTELENKVKELSIQKTRTVVEQKETKVTKESAPSKNDGAKVAYLTFDDGPSANTEQILDILKKHKIKATFFVNGNTSKKDLYKRIVDEGHSIGNHTYSHNYASIYSTVDDFLKDINKLNDFLEEVTGVRPNIIRFPGGSNNTVSHKYGGTEIMKEIVQKVVESGYQYFDWNVSSNDAEKLKQDKEVIVNSVLEGTKNKSKAVILMHDSAPKTTTAEALPEIIEGLIEQGFTFDSLDESSYAPHFKL